MTRAHNGVELAKSIPTIVAAWFFGKIQDSPKSWCIHDRPSTIRWASFESMARIAPPAATIRDSASANKAV
jgi:hypothetical protein